jgi:tetratricopeptide (TPR) repeat protein
VTILTCWEQVKDLPLGSESRPDTIGSCQILVHSGFLESGMRRLWINGKWIEILLANIRIGSEHRMQHAEKVSSLTAEALQLLAAGDGKTAAELLHSALELEPDAPDVKFNLAAAMQLQGKNEQSQALVEEIYQVHPDYFFGRTGLAQLHLRDENYEQALMVMEPLFHLRSMSPSELDAFCGVNIDLQVGLQNLQAARAWFGFWESANPQNQKLEIYRLKMGGMEVFEAE